MLEIYKLINTILTPICTCYADHYPTTLEQEDGNKLYPYIEFSFPYATPNNTYSENNLLYIDIWDNKSGNVEGIETLADSVDKAINRLQIHTDKMQVCVSRNNPFRFPIPDPSLNIQRRQLRYIVKVYYKE